MARYISKKVGKANRYLTDKITIDGSDVMTGPSNKAWRSLILLHRATHSPNDTADTKTDPAKVNGELAYKKEERNKYVKKGKRQYIGRGKYLEFSGENDDGFKVPFDTSIIDRYQKLKAENANNILIFNISTDKYQFIVLQNRPTSVEFKGETSWVSIKSMGRNTPMYHYTGAEDILQFNVSWYANDDKHANDVITKCRLLESWSKADGYKAAPPILRILWGNSGIFSNQTYILTSATYTLKNFNDKSRIIDKDPKILKIRDYHLYPRIATQELVFKRVSAKNLEYSDIIDPKCIEYTRGIGKV